MFYVYINEDRTCTVYMVEEYIPESLKDGIIEYPTIPEGEGILKAHEDGTLYIETIEPEPDPDPDPNTETPIKPEPPVLSIEEMQAQILLNTEYLVSRAELGLGGI